MAPLTTRPARTYASSTRRLRVVGTLGSALALAILGASMLLRLTAIFGTDGKVISTLPAVLENATRMLHRLAASGVGFLAVYAVILWWSHRPLPSHVFKAIAGMVAITVILALIGPLTPGYRVAAITIANVAGGVVLLMAFWWLRETVASDSAARQPIDPLLRATIFVFLAHVVTGAAASAYEMYGVRWFTFLHLGTALLSTMFIGATLWDRRSEPLLASCAAVTTMLITAQLAIGLTLVSLGARPIWLAYLHGMLSPMLAIALISMVTRDSVIQQCTRSGGNNDA